MNRKYFALIGLLGCTTQAIAQESPPVLPVEQTPYHLPVFSNHLVTLLNVSIPSGATAGYHRHALDSVALVVAQAKTRSQVLGEVAKERENLIGTLSYSPYGQRSLVHNVTNIDAGPVRVILVELLEPEPSGTKAATRAAAYKVELDNERVRAWRLRLDPGQQAPVINQSAPGMRLVVESGQLIESQPGHPDRAMDLKTGDFFWQDAGFSRSLRNAGSTPIELIEFELK
jgi:hypothetical protein